MFDAFDATLLARLQFAFTVSLPFHLPGLHHRAGQLSRRARGAVAVDRPRGLSRPVQLLDEDLRPRLRHGRRVGHRHVLPVRHQLVGLLRQGRAGDRPADGLRGADRLLPRGRLPRRHAVRHEPGRQGPAFRRHAARSRSAPSSRPSGSCRPTAGCRRRPATRSNASGQFVPADWLADHLQSVLPLPPRAHGARRLSHHRAGGRRRRRLASAARPRRPRARA